MNSTFGQQALEWQSLLQHYSSHCQSAPAKEAALFIEPATGEILANELLELTHEAIAALSKDAFSFLSGLEIMDTVLERLLRGSVLDGKELLQLSRLANIAHEIRLDRKSTRLNSSHSQQSRMPSSA